MNEVTTMKGVTLRIGSTFKFRSMTSATWEVVAFMPMAQPGVAGIPTFPAMKVRAVGSPKRVQVILPEDYILPQLDILEIDPTTVTQPAEVRTKSSKTDWPYEVVVSAFPTGPSFAAICKKGDGRMLNDTELTRLLMAVDWSKL